MAVGFSGGQNIKMISFDVVTSCFNNVASDSRRVISSRKGFKMFCLPIVKSSFGYNQYQQTSFDKYILTLLTSDFK